MCYTLKKQQKNEKLKALKSLKFQGFLVAGRGFEPPTSGHAERKRPIQAIATSVGCSLCKRWATAF